MLIPFENEGSQLDWGALQGTSVGDFALREFLGADAATAVFRAEPNKGEPGDSVVKLYRVDQDSVADAQTEVWLEAAKLNHPNLIRVRGAGRASLEEQKLIYVAVEPADESLASALSQRRLEPAEAAEILTSAKSALEYLHNHGFIHSCLAPEQIFAVGDAIKLSTEGLRKPGPPKRLIAGKPKFLAPESTDVNTSRGADVWCLGATLLEATTGQNVSTGKWSAQTAPEQLRTVVHRCLIVDPNLRTSLVEIGREPIAPAATAPPVTSATHTAPEPTPLPQPARPAPPKTLYPLKPDRTGLPFWAYAGAAVVLIAILIWLFRPSSAPRPANTTAVVPAAQQKTVVPAAGGASIAAPAEKPAQPEQVVEKPSPAKEIAREKPSAKAPVVAAPKPDAKTEGGNTVKGDVWRVVVYTYQNEGDAKNSADAINSKHPQLKASEFSPDGKPPYLVVVGGAMSRPDAKHFRQEAIRLGMPHDSYAQNFEK